MFKAVFTIVFLFEYLTSPFNYNVPLTKFKLTSFSEFFFARVVN